MITINPKFPGFKQFFKDLLTIYQREVDTYKDVNKEGLFERYMATFGEYIDLELSSEIENYLDIIDANVADEKFLNHLSDVLGNPPDIFKNLEQYRNLLSYIVSVYKVKGTTLGYKLFFYIFGFDVTITEIEPIPISNIYDDGNQYDDGEIYEPETCSRCSVYTISIKHISQSNFTIDSTLISLLRDAISFNEPINAVLGNFTIVVEVEDTITGISLEDLAYSNIHTTESSEVTDTIGSMGIVDEVITNLIQNIHVPTISIQWNDTLDTVDKVCNLFGCPYTIKLTYNDVDNDITTVAIQQSTNGIDWITIVANNLVSGTPTIHPIIIHEGGDISYKAIATDSLGNSTTSNIIRAYSTYVTPPVSLYDVTWIANNEGNIKMSTQGEIDFTPLLASRTIDTIASYGHITGYVIAGMAPISCDIPMDFTISTATWNTDTLPVVTDKVLTSLIYTVNIIFNNASEYDIIDEQTNAAIEADPQYSSSYSSI